MEGETQLAVVLELMWQGVVGVEVVVGVAAVGGVALVGGAGGVGGVADKLGSYNQFDNHSCYNLWCTTLLILNFGNYSSRNLL